MKPETPVSLTLGLVEAILQYMSARPYGEVFRLVQEVQAQVLPQVAPSQTAAADEPAGLTD